MPTVTGDSVSDAAVNETGSQQATTASATGAAAESTATGNGASAVMPSLAGGLMGGLMVLWNAL